MGNPIEALMGNDGHASTAPTLRYLPPLDVSQALAGGEGGLSGRLRCLEELLVRDACTLGGLLGYSMAVGQEVHSGRVLSGLLGAGLTYVTQGDRGACWEPTRRAAAFSRSCCVSPPPALLRIALHDELHSLLHSLLHS